MPWLLLNRRTPTSRRHVLLDDEAAAHLATTHLLDLGHRRIGMIGGPSTGRLRDPAQAGFRPGPGRTPDRRRGQSSTPSTPTPADGSPAFTLMTQAPDTTAVVVANIASASGALIGIREAGFTVPEQVSVITIHDHPLVEAFSPPLTTVSLPLHELGRRALEVLMDTPRDATRRRTHHRRPDPHHPGLHRATAVRQPDRAPAAPARLPHQLLRPDTCCYTVS